MSKNLIVLDLEWNQSNIKEEAKTAELPFEIIEIGAIKCNEERVMVGEFSELIKPAVYHEMHHITSKLIHMQIEELNRGRSFKVVMAEFLDWCGDNYIFCTWGPLDLTELQRNMNYYEMTPLSDGPIVFLDIQKIFSLAFEDGKLRRSLEYAVDFLEIEKDIPFHRAFSDAYYTAKVMLRIPDDKVFQNISYDIYHPPLRREDEIKIQFDGYMKYISRAFADKAEAFTDKEVISSKCYLCHKNLRKKIKWFTPNGRQYYAAAYCDKHGFIKYKNRIRKTDDGRVYIVKTSKFISADELDILNKRSVHIQELRKKKKQKG